MLNKPRECEGCPLFIHGRGFSQPEGKATLGVALIGEALGENEMRAGLPFRPEAPAGSVLERAIKRSGYDRQQFVIGNVVWCQPPKNWLDGAPYEQEAIEHCRPNLDQLVLRYRPKVLMALGGVPLRTLTGMAGKARGISMLRGYVLDGTRYPGIPVIGSHHPSFLRRGGKSRDDETGGKVEGGSAGGGMSLFGVLCRDLRFAVEVAQNGFSFQRPSYIERPGHDEARSFLLRVRDNPQLVVTYDIETSGSGDVDEEELEKLAAQEITQIQFSLGVGEGIVFPWESPYVEIAQEIMATQNPKAGHNSAKFDNPRLRARGFIINGVNHDTMEMWRKAQPDLPAGLQFVASFFGFPFPWKHLFDSNRELYCGCDVDAPQRIMAQLPDDMKAKGIWRSYERHVLGLDPVLVSMSKRGILIDNERRLKFATRLDAEIVRIDAGIQEIVPDSIKNVHPKEGYKKPPADAVVDASTTYQGEPAKWDKRTFTIISKDLTETQEERWVKVLPFKLSSQQIIRYMQHRGHPVPKNPKTDRDTSSHRELERLEKQTKDPLYRQIIESRGVSIMRKTFVEGWAPAADGRVHSEYYHATGTGQLSSRRPNVQNRPSPKYGDAAKMELAKEFAGIVVASPGHTLIELDFKSAHALTLGFEAKDPDYMRLSRIDTHGFFAAAGLLRLERPERLLALPDPELKAYLKGLRKNTTTLYQGGKTFEQIRNDKAKKTILGYGFGMGYRTLFNQNPDAFDNERDAKKTIEILNGLFSRTAKFRDTIRKTAHQATNLISRHGYIRWFFDVYHWDARRNMWLPGDDSEAAIAFLPANDAHGHMKDVMITLAENGWDERYGLINQIHDALLFDCPNELVEEALYGVKTLMELPSTILVDPDVAPGGLWIEASASVGKDWASMEDVDVQAPLPKAA